MPRLIDILLTLTYSMACCVGALALMRIFGVPPVGTMIVAAAGILLCLQLHLAGSSNSFRHDVRKDIAKLRKEQTRLEKAATETAARLKEITEDFAVRGEERERALVSEMKVIETLIERMGERMPAGGAARRPASGGAPNEDMLSVVREALQENRVDLYLQPIVSLPQRRVSFYESYTRLRDASGRVVMPGEFLKVAMDAGLMTAIDNLLLFRCVQIVRRLSAKDRQTGVFCNLSPESLEDPDFFPQFMDFMRQNSDLSSSLIFEIGQDSFLRRSPEAARNMARLADFGFRFSIDHATDLSADFADMRRAGVKFFKVPGEILVERLLGGAEMMDVSPEDYVGHLARFGIELIAEKIETEATVVEILDFDAAFGQGHLFGEPRPIREDALTETHAPIATPTHADIPRAAAMH